MPLSADRDIARVLASASAHAIAVVGASSNPQRPSYQVAEYLGGEGYTLFPVNPGLVEQELLGFRTYRALSDIPVAIDMVLVFRQSRFVAEVMREALALGVKTVWTQLGVVDFAAAQAGEERGIEVVMDRCAAIEIRRLREKGLLCSRDS